MIFIGTLERTTQWRVHCKFITRWDNNNARISASCLFRAWWLRLCNCWRNTKVRIQGGANWITGSVQEAYSVDVFERRSKMYFQTIRNVLWKVVEIFLVLLGKNHAVDANSLGLTNNHKDQLGIIGIPFNNEYQRPLRTALPQSFSPLSHQQARPFP